MATSTFGIITFAEFTNTDPSSTMIVTLPLLIVFKVVLANKSAIAYNTHDDMVGQDAGEFAHTESGDRRTDSTESSIGRCKDGHI